MRLGTALEGLLDKKGRRSKEARLQARVDSAWDEAVGDEIAGHTRGMAVRDQTLRVSVDSHAWAAQLTFMETQLRRRLNEELGEQAIRQIQFIVSKDVECRRRLHTHDHDTKRRYGGSEVDPVPLTAEEIERVEAEAEVIGSERLKQAAIRARVRELEWKKGKEAAREPQSPSSGARGDRKPSIP